MKALQVKRVANKGVIARQEKRIKNLTDGQDQYKDALRTLNKEVKELKEKLEEEGHQRKKDQEAKQTVEKEMMALLGQVETAKADVVKKFKDSLAFIDSYAEYYGVGFEDCLKQVKSNYPHLDLEKVSMDEPLPTTPTGDTIPEGADGAIESEQDTQDDYVILAQPALNPPVIPLTPSANPPVADDPSSQDTPDQTKVTGPHKTSRPHELRVFLFLVKFI